MLDYLTWKAVTFSNIWNSLEKNCNHTNKILPSGSFSKSILMVPATAYAITKGGEAKQLARVLGWTRPSKFLFPDSTPTATRSPYIWQEKNQVTERRLPRLLVLDHLPKSSHHWLPIFKSLLLGLLPVGEKSAQWCPYGRHSRSEDRDMVSGFCSGENSRWVRRKHFGYLAGWA